MYQLLYEKSVFKDLDKIPSKNLDQIQKVFKKIAENPRQKGIKKLTGYSNRYRFRQGDYRVIYSIKNEQKVLNILFVRHRKDVYRIN